MADKQITRRLKIYVNGQEVDNTISNLTKNLSKFRALANRQIEGTDEWKKYNAEVAKLELELNSARSAQKAFREDTKLTEQGIDKSGRALAEFTGSFSQMLQGFRNGDILQVQEGFNGVRTGIQGATKAALAFIATPIGAAIAALVGIGAATKAWFDYNSAVIEAVRTTTQITGLTDQAADQARIRAESLSEAFDVDFKETLESAKTLAVQFGISFEEAFDVIEGQLVRGQANNDEFFDSLKEYPVFFQQAGFSAEEFGRIIAAGFDLGIYSDKFPDALKEFDLALKEQTTATRDALINAFGAPFTDSVLRRVRTGEITTKQALEEIAAQAEESNINIQQNAQLTADLFKGAGEDAGGALKIFEAYNIAINENQRALTESQQLIQDQIDANNELKAVTSAIFATGDQGFGLLIDKAKLFGTKILIDVLKAGIDVYNWIVDLNNESRAFSGILTTIGVLATAPFDTLGILINNAKAAFGGLGKVIEGVFTLDADRIREGMNQGVLVSVKALDELKQQALADAEEIKTAFSGGSKLERKTLNDFVSADGGVPTPGVTPTGGGVFADNQTGGDAKKDELTPEDKRRLESRKKVTEFLKKFDEEQKIEQQIKDLEEAEAAQLKEELELEAKYALLRQNAEDETELLARLKEAQETELAEIDARYKSEAEKKEAEHQKKLNEQEKKANAERLAARRQLQADIINGVVALAGEETKVGQALLIAKQFLAAKETLIEISKLKSRASIAAADASLSITQGTAKTASAGFPAAIPLLLLFAAQAVGIISSVRKATQQAKSVKAPSFFDGGFTQSGPQTGGVDGRGGQWSILHPDEYVIPKIVRRDPEVPAIIDYLESKRTKKVRSFETGGNVTPMDAPAIGNDDMTAILFTRLMQKLDEPLKILYTLNDEIQRRELAQKLDDTINESKGK